MKFKTIKAVLATVAAIAATVAGLDVTGFVSVLPPDLAAWLVIAPSAAAAILHAAEALQANLRYQEEKEIMEILRQPPSPKNTTLPEA
jgi:hypothetical protein